ncbi:hypothetical protein [Hymenobacter psychrotolerans]|uniref:Uncharacterized protein n=1 Tax=Hymenobacter psychrotolerans DSM 18569 TaxID=1121959 RepID=A0A1M6QC10_9BACT|nr:hypothetical protein [Hymenobacter psychrotolerans]SHK17708.1 hypothetical protein SAMN02746009_00513 [Hymenobacter psychrotolerans DSM 18569]
MAPKYISYLWLGGWLVFYAAVLPYAVPLCLDWLSSPSDWWLICGLLGVLVLAAGVVLSLYQAGRAILRYFSTSIPSSSPPNGRISTKP